MFSGFPRRVGVGMLIVAISIPSPKPSPRSTPSILQKLINNPLTPYTKIASPLGRTKRNL